QTNISHSTLSKLFFYSPFDIIKVMAEMDFEDLLPVIANKLGGEGLMKELSNGFELLMDKDKGVITLESLRKNSALMGLEDLKEDEVVSMMREGDVDGDGELSEMEFCVLMFRLSPQLMEESWSLLRQALQNEVNNHDS
ncbi:hypothetical protein KIW84_057422, partial [Lathyrus oleraceus]